MKKTLKFVKSESTYLLKAGEEILINISDKKISGQDIYDKIYSELESNEKSEITIIPEGFLLEGEKIKEKEDRLVFDQVKELFSQIDRAVSSSVETSK